MLPGIISGVLGVISVVVGILTLMTDELNKNKKLKFTVVGVLFFVAFWAMLGSISSLQNASTTPPQTTQPTALSVIQSATQTPFVVTQVVEVTPTPDDQVISIESMSSEVYPKKGSQLKVVLGGVAGIEYEHTYSYSDELKNGAGLYFTFKTIQDLSNYQSVEFTITADDKLPDACEFVLFNDKGGSQIPCKDFDPAGGIIFVDNGNQRIYTIPLQGNFSRIDIRRVQGAYFWVFPSASTETIVYRLSNLKFIKR